MTPAGRRRVSTLREFASTRLDATEWRQLSELDDETIAQVTKFTSSDVEARVRMLQWLRTRRDHVPSIREATCPFCTQEFLLQYEKDPVTLRISSSPSAGIYGVQIICPSCGFEEELV